MAGGRGGGAVGIGRLSGPPVAKGGNTTPPVPPRRHVSAWRRLPFCQELSLWNISGRFEVAASLNLDSPFQDPSKA